MEKLTDSSTEGNDSTFWERLETNKPKTKKDKQYYYNIFYRRMDEESRKEYRDIKGTLPIWESLYIKHFMSYVKLNQEDIRFLLNEIEK